MAVPIAAIATTISTSRRHDEDATHFAPTANITSNNNINNQWFDIRNIQLHPLASRSRCDGALAPTDLSADVISHSSSLLGSRATYPANHPLEDRDVMIEAGDYRLGIVFDGHGGWNVSDYASKNLPPLVLKKLSELRHGAADDAVIDEAIASSFQEIEDAYIASIANAYDNGFGSVAKVGSCVGMALKKGNRLTIANAGDCRSVMGSQLNDTYYATRLSRDHNARVPLEVANLQRQHPGEDDVVRCHKNNPSACYVKGRLQLTRSLGDLYLKNGRFNAKEGQPRSMGRHIPDPYTPPYVSHRPDMTHVRLDPQDKFVIVASDGVWDFLSDEEAVRIVGDCLSNNQPPHHAPGASRNSSSSSSSGASASEVAARVLVEATLRRAAEECGMSYEQLLALPPGKHRRSRHDDTTAVVLLF